MFAFPAFFLSLSLVDSLFYDNEFPFMSNPTLRVYGSYSVLPPQFRKIDGGAGTVNFVLVTSPVASWLVL